MNRLLGSTEKVYIIKFVRNVFLLTRCRGAQTHMQFIYLMQVSYHVLSNAERKFGHALSQALSYLSVQAQVRSQANPYEIGVLTDWHLDRFL